MPKRRTHANLYELIRDPTLRHPIHFVGRHMYLHYCINLVQRPLGLMSAGNRLGRPAQLDLGKHWRSALFDYISVSSAGLKWRKHDLYDM